jgi:hypothetical protein
MSVFLTAGTISLGAVTTEDCLEPDKIGAVIGAVLGPILVDNSVDGMEAFLTEEEVDEKEEDTVEGKEEGEGVERDAAGAVEGGTAAAASATGEIVEEGGIWCVCD